MERKRRTLERLRREAQRRGIKLGPGSASEPDIVVELQPEPKSITEAKLRAKLQAKKKVISLESFSFLKLRFKFLETSNNNIILWMENFGYGDIQYVPY